MPSHREVLSPLTTPNIQQQVNKFISPSTSRHVSLKSPVPMLTGEHDDAAEKRERRRSRIIQLQQTVGSPVSPADRRRSLPLSGLSANQLAEHYASCIKLSAENKINAKNAFGLHLIDYMSDLVKKKELDNFQVASTTLDASAKIYAGRVDAIHAETYKVLTGLGRGSDKSKQSEEDEGGEQVTEEHGEEEVKKKKKTKKNNAVETNLKNISVNKLDLEFEVDPLFQVMSKTFDEGGSSGLLLNNLRCFDDQQELVLDSSTPTASIDQLNDSQRTTTSLTEIKDMFRGVDFDPKSICPPFSTFGFTDWDSTMETSVVPTTSSAHAFDLNAEPEPIMDMDTEATDMPPADFPADFPADGSFGDDDNAESDSEQHVSEKSVFIGDGKAAQLMQSAIRDLTHGTTGTLLSVLASEPSDYSYFNKALLRTWAGPSHWRLGPLSKDPRFKSIADKSQKTKKALFRIDYDEEEDFTPYLKTSKGTCLTKATLTKYSKERNTLPKDLHYDADKLFRLFCKSKVMIKRQNTSSDNIDDDIENYDYENTNDRENFCPKGSEGDEDDDAGGDFDFNFTEGGENYSQESADFTSQPDNETLLSGTMLTGDKLVAQPHKVSKINIDYAKTAKKLDVKRLKGTIWKLLTKKGKKKSEEIQGDESAQEPTAGTSETGAELSAENRSTSPDSDKSDEDMQGSCSFQELLTDLPQHVSGNMAKNISVPIAFVCLLHLANEKTLKIESENMSDLKITQGI